MKTRLLSLLFLLSAISAFCQIDPTKLTYYRNQYGQRVAHLQIDTALVPPSDTVHNKTGIALVGGIFYTGNGTYWSEVAGSGAVSVTPSDFAFLNVKKDFGAKGDGLADDADNFQAMFDWVQTHPATTYKCVVPAGDYYIGSTVQLPQRINSSAESPRLSIEGAGARLFTDQAIAIFERLPATQTIALDSLIANWIPQISGFTFEGDQTTGQVGIRIGATYSMVVKDCNFSSLDTGVVSLFGLQASFNNLRFTLNKSENLVIDFGERWGGTDANSQSNSNAVDNCRVFGASGAYSHFHAVASNGLIVRNFISEGAKPQYNFVVDYAGSTNVTYTSLSDLHVESSGGVYSANTVFRIRSNGTFAIKDVYVQYPDTLFNSTGSAGSSTIIFDGIPYTGNLPSVAFNANGLTTLGYNIVFRNITDGPGFATKLFNSASWVGGVVPTELFYDYEKQSGSGSKAIAAGGTIDLEPGKSSNPAAINFSGHQYFTTDNTFDVGGTFSSGLNKRVRDLFIGRDLYVDNAGSIKFGDAITAPDIEFVRAAVSSLNLTNGSSGFSNLHLNGGQFDSLSGYTNSYTYAQLGNQDFVAKEQLEEALSTVNSTISIGELMTGVGSIADPINPDTSTGKIATKTDVEFAKDSIGRTEGIDSFQVYRNGVHIYSVKDSVGGVAEGTGDNWGTQGVLADSYHSGTGKVGDTLRIDTSALFPAIRETIPNAPFPGLFGGTGITISGNDETGYTVVNTGSPGSNPRAALSILDFGGARDAIIPSTGSVPTSGTDNTPALNNMIAAAQDGQVCYIPYGNYWFKTTPDTIGKYNKRVILIIDGNTYHINTSGAGINFLVFKNLSGPFEQHYIEHNGVCFGKINPATHSNSAHDAGTGPVWSAYTGTAFTIYNCNQNYIRFNKIEGFKNGLEVIGQDYDAAGRGSQENTFVGRWLYKNANDIVLTSLNGSSYCDKNKFFVDRVSGGLGIKIDGYSGLSQYNDPISGVQENWNGAFRSNEFHLMIEGVDSVADVYGDVTEPEFDVTIEGSGVYGDHGWRLKSTSPNYVRDPKFNGQGVYGYQWVQEGMGINARGDVPIWNSTSGRRFSNTWKTDGSGNVVFVGSTLTKFQRDDSPTTFLYAPGNDAESDKAITASTYTASAGEVIQYSNASGTITLPTAGSNVGKRITIMNTHASASVTIANAANYTSIPAGDNMTYRSDGNNWRGIVNAEGSGGGGGGGDSTFTFDTNGKTTTYKLGVRTASKSNSAFAFPASTTSVSSFNVPTGSHPTSPADGDEWRVAKARYMAYNGITYEYLTVPDNGQAGQIVRRNAANDGYEHAYPNFEVAYSLTTSIASTGASSSSKTSLTGGAQTLNPVSTGDIIELHGAGTIATASSGTPAPTFDLVFGSSATTFNTTTLAANKLYQYRYDIRITVGNKWDVKLEISESSGGGSLAPVVYWQSGNGTTGLVTSAPVINLRSWFTNADNLLTAYSSTIEIKR